MRTRMLASMILSIICIVSIAVAADTRKSVLVIESYHAEYEWDKSYMRGIHKGLDDIAMVHSFQMNTKRLPHSMFQQKADEAFAYFLESKPDLVMLADDNAAALLGARMVKANVPLVYLGVNGNPRAYGLHNAPKVLGVLERPLVKRSIKILSDLSPKIRQVLVLFDDSTTSYEVMRTMLNGEPEFSLYNVNCKMVRATFYASWQQEVQDVVKNGYDAILLGTYHTLRDDAGNVVHEDIALNWINEHSVVPLFALWDFTIKKGGAAAGFMLRGEDQGFAAAQLARSLFEGTQASAQNITIEPSLIFSRSEMSRWGLAPNATMRKRAVWVD